MNTFLPDWFMTRDQFISLSVYLFICLSVYLH